MDYDELSQKVKQHRTSKASKLKNNYRYARSKGFSSEESNFLKTKSFDEIDAIAGDRDSKKGE